MSVRGHYSINLIQLGLIAIQLMNEELSKKKYKFPYFTLLIFMSSKHAVFQAPPRKRAQRTCVFS